MSEGLFDLNLTQRCQSGEPSSFIHLDNGSQIEYRVRALTKFCYELPPGRSTMLATNITIENVNSFMFVQKNNIHPHLCVEDGGLARHFQGRLFLSIANLSDSKKIIPQGHCIAFLHISPPSIYQL